MPATIQLDIGSKVNMATASDVARLARRSESLKALSLGLPPLLNDAPFARFPEMAAEIRRFNEETKRRDERLKNLLADALLASRSIPP
jgi:hypothetical protein